MSKEGDSGPSTELWLTLKGWKPLFLHILMACERTPAAAITFPPNAWAMTSGDTYMATGTTTLDQTGPRRFRSRSDKQETHHADLLGGHKALEAPPVMQLLPTVQSLEVELQQQAMIMYTTGLSNNAGQGTFFSTPNDTARLHALSSPSVPLPRHRP